MLPFSYYHNYLIVNFIIEAQIITCSYNVVKILANSQTSLCDYRYISTTLTDYKYSLSCYMELLLIASVVCDVRNVLLVDYVNTE